MASVQRSPFVKQLASNSRKVREDALESLRNYMTTKQFMAQKQLQFDQLWKGLYYAMWFSDRPRPQQRLAHDLGELFVLYLNNIEKDTELHDRAFIKFSIAFWKVICIEWYNIDHHRLDKYLLLIRRVLYFQLKYLAERGWNAELVEKYIAKVLRKLPLSGEKRVYNGIPFHIIDIFIDEWEKLVLGDEDNDDDKELPDDQKREIISATPLASFISIFEDLAKNLDNIKVLREKIKEDILSDARLLRWGVRDEEKDHSGKQEEEVEENEEEEEEEWHGF